MPKDNLEQLKEALSKDSYTNSKDRYTPKHLFEEFLYSLVIALVPAFISIVIHISNHMETTAHEALIWLLWSFGISTVVIFGLRQIIPKKPMKWIAFIFIGLIFALMLFKFAVTGIVCAHVGGSEGHYRDSQGVVHDLNGNLVTQIGTHGDAMDTVCYITPDQAQKILAHKSFFDQFVTYIVKNW